MNTTVRDVMSSQIVAVRRGATFKEMAATLREYRISGFPVIDDHGKVIGVVSEADLLARQHGEHKQAEGLVAGDLMTHPAVTVGPDDAVEHAARMMYSLQLKRLPVIDAGGFLVGIAIRHVRGVVALRDELGYPPAESSFVPGLYF